MSKELQKLQRDIIAFRDARDWKQFHNPKDLALSICLESAELLEHFQWKNGDDIKKHINDKKDEIGEEMADVLNYLLIMANDLNIDLYDVSIKKLEKNNAKYSVEKSKGSSKKYTEL